MEVASSDVVLPDGRGVIAVGSARHTWTVALGAHTVEQAQLPLGMTMGELMDREDAVHVFKDLLVSYFPEAAEVIESGSGAPAEVRGKRRERSCAGVHGVRLVSGHGFSCGTPVGVAVAFGERRRLPAPGLG
ncbi:hypothetical protein AB0958_39425 [Streptomyces sp. NPDC006655]|uniref:hypothetical protein n=1 Tax=Streptomyces sp. NPDC006655 TaxID=3156898 RepID=UPI003452BF06